MRSFFERVALRRDNSRSSGATQNHAQERESNLVIEVLATASRAVMTAIDLILRDSAGLSSDDLAGFYRLVELIESEPESEDINNISCSNGYGCISILLKHKSDPNFIDTCVRAALAPVLMHAMRLLRMLEVKMANVIHTEESYTCSPDESVTNKSSLRISTIMAVLCSSNETIEQLRPSLTKLLCIPMSPLPEGGVHFQIHVAKVVHSVCQTALTPQIIWALRDSQAIHHMVKTFRDMATILPADAKLDNILRGQYAERQGMWTVGASVLVDLLTAAEAFSPVLRSDFELVGGYDLLTQLVLRSHRDRSVEMMRIVVGLIVCLGSDVEVIKPLANPGAGTIFVDIICSFLHIPVGGLSGTENSMDLVAMSAKIFKNLDVWGGEEFVLQNIAYSLLPLYSSHPQNYSVLESSHQILPLLILCLPSFRIRETSSAVLKALDFVCLETIPKFCIIALCASTAVMVGQCVAVVNSSIRGHNASFLKSNRSSALPANAEEQLKSQKRLGHVMGFLEDLTKRDEKYGLIFFRCGLKLLLCDYLSDVDGDSSAFSLNCEESLTSSLVFSSVIKLVVNTMKEYPSVAADLKNTDLPALVFTVLPCVRIDSGFAKVLLSILEQQSLADTSVYDFNVKKLIILVITLIDQKEKATYVLDTLSWILQFDVGSKYGIWQQARGFDAILSLTCSMAGAFDAAAAIVAEEDPSEDNSSGQSLATHLSNAGARSFPRTFSLNSQVEPSPAGDGLSHEEITFKCLHSIIKCLSIVLITLPNQNLENIISNRQFFRECVKYPTLVQHLLATGVFQSSKAERCVHALFMLVTGSDTRSNRILNPDGVALIIDVLPLLEVSLAVRAIDRIKSLAMAQMDGCQILSESGVVIILVNKFQAVLQENSHPLQAPLTMLMITICSNYLSLPDFAEILRYIVRPSIVMSVKANKLLPSWEYLASSNAAANKSWDSVQLLLDLAVASSWTMGVSFVSLGSAACNVSNKRAAYLRANWVDMPASFSFTCWAQFGGSHLMRRLSSEESGSQSGKGTTPIFTLSCPSGGLLEIQLEASTSLCRIITRQGKGKPASVIVFTLPPIGEMAWHLFVVSLKRTKRVVSSAKVFLTIYFDGQSVFKDNLDYDPCVDHEASLFVGRSIVESIESSETSSTHSESKVYPPLDLVKLWHIGPLLVFDDCLTQIQVSRIMTKGPGYHGTFQGESPMEDSLTSLVTYMLCKCNIALLPIDELMISLGFKGLEMVVVPQFESTSSEHVSFDMSALPLPIMAFGAMTTICKPGKSGVESGVKLINVASIDASPIYAELLNGWHISHVDSVAHCVAALSGPSVLMPLVQAASCEKHLLMTFNLFLYCVRNDLSNLKYMHIGGYQLLGFLLSKKPKNIITNEVVEVLFSLCVDMGLKRANSPGFSILLVDTLAFHNLILNHQLWDPHRPAFATQVVDMIKSLVYEDARHGVLNAKRLSLMGVVQWILSLCLFAVDQTGKYTADSERAWFMHCRSAEEDASSRDVKDPFLSSAVYIIKSILLCDLRQSALEAIANVILQSCAVAFNQDNSAAVITTKRTPRKQRVSFTESPSSPPPQNANYRDGASEDLQTPIRSFAVALLRILREVYSTTLDADSSGLDKSTPRASPDIMSMYSSLFTPKWFFVVIEKSGDQALTAFCMRLVACMIQRDVSYRRTFAAADGFKVLTEQLSDDDQSLAVMLPIIALFFRIPIKFLPMPADVTTMRMTDMLDKANGPIDTEPDVSDFTLPALNLMLQCYSYTAKHRNLSKFCLQNEIIVTLLINTMDNKQFMFSQISQQRSFVEVMTAALLRCSNAFDEYGSRIFADRNSGASLRSSPTSTAKSLNMYVIDDYFSRGDLDGLGDDVGKIMVVNDPHHENPYKEYVCVESESFTGSKYMLRSRDIAVQEAITPLEVTLVAPEGVELLALLNSCIRNALVQYRNPQVIGYFLIGFPKYISEAYACGYQILLFKGIASMFRSIFDEVNSDALPTLCQALFFIVPIVKARLLHDSVLLELFKVIIYGFEAMDSNEALNWLGSDKHAIILRDLGLSARFYAIMNVHAAIVSDNVQQRATTLQYVRSNIHLLCKLSYEEISDATKMAANKTIEERKPPIAVLDHYHVSLVTGATTKDRKKEYAGVESTIATCVQDMIRVSQNFSLFLVVSVYPFILEDDQAIRFEAMRICAALLIHRKHHVLDILTPPVQKNRKSSHDLGDSGDQVISLFDGLSKLLPDSVGQLTLYSKSLRTISEVSAEGEMARFAEFLNWLTEKNNDAACSTFLFNLEGIVDSLSPSSWPILVAVKDIQTSRARYDTVHQFDVEGGSYFGEEFQRLAATVVSQVKQWLMYGCSGNTFGGNMWKGLWCSLQSNPMWGIVPVSHSEDKRNLSTLERTENDSRLTFTPLNSDTDSQMIAPIMWRLDVLEGPEKCHKRMEQDYDEEIVNLAGCNVDVIESAKENSADLSATTTTTTVADVTVNYVEQQEGNFEEFLKSLSKSTGHRHRAPTTIDSEFVFDDSLLYEENDIDRDENGVDMVEEADENNEDTLSPLKSNDASSAPSSAPAATSLGWRSNSVKQEADSSINSIVQSKKLSLKLSKGILSAAAMALPDAMLAAITPKKDSASSDLFDDGPSGSLADYSIGSWSGGMPTPTLQAVANASNSAMSWQQAVMPSADDEVTRRNNILMELVSGIVGIEEWLTAQTLNIKRIFGLEARSALLVLTPKNIHILDGFQINMCASGEKVIEWSEIVSKSVGSTGLSSSKRKEKRITSLNRKQNLALENEKSWLDKIWYQLLHVDFGYFQIPLHEVYAIYKRRHELQYTALEVVDLSGQSIMFSCGTKNDCELTLKKLLDYDMPNSIFHRAVLNNLKIAGGGLFFHSQLMGFMLSNMTKLWQRGMITNFEYIMQLNTLAGRSFQDLTQYPVFPWIIADYDSDTLDLSNPATFRDLSKPMGALGGRRSMQYIERYESMNEFHKEGLDGSPPPFFYGTHYSCAGYVLNYLMRMQPYSRMAKALQGGQFDKADRLFRGVKASWLSASQENLQDVRELTPEFFSFPDFLRNSNNFDLGCTQNGEQVGDVILPNWAKGDANEFIRVHREALECKYVSENLHNWIDLIFGYKQKGPAAVSAQNLFIHLTYEGEVNIDDIADTMLRDSTISQINNFGQTPARLFPKPHPKRNVPDVVKRAQDGGLVVDSYGLSWHEYITPPLCVVGKSHVVSLKNVFFSTASFPNNVKAGLVGDVQLSSKDRVVSVPADCLLLPPRYLKYVRYGKSCGGLSFHTAWNLASRSLEGERDVTFHEHLHSQPLTCIAANHEGDILVTGGRDRSVRLWSINRSGGTRRLEHYATFCGHSGVITGVDICSIFSITVSCSEDRSVMVWDMKRKKLLRVLDNHKGKVVSVSINSISGNICTLTATELRVYSLNGEVLASSPIHSAKGRGGVVKAPPSGDWQDGIVAVTGHESGNIFLWKMVVRMSVATSTVARELIPFSLIKMHKYDICALSICNALPLPAKKLSPRSHVGEVCYELLAGDTEGNISRWVPIRLDQIPPSDLHNYISLP